MNNVSYEWIRLGMLLLAVLSLPVTGKERSPELWRTYMHGIVPDQAVSISIREIVKQNPESGKFVSHREMLGHEPSFRILKNSQLTVTLPINLVDCKGSKIRLFYWCKGIKVGWGNGWHAPWLVLIAQDRSRKNLFAREAWFHTEGTYPWYCYYVECFLPAETERFAIRFYTPNGIAYFSGFAWEKITPENTYDNNYKQDPVSGSLAPNIYYDQMPEHMTYGYGNRYPFRWMLGNKIGLVGQPDDITTLSGFTHYFHTKGIKKPEHLNHAILHLGNAYRFGLKNKLLPPMEEGWLENFRNLLLEAQDSRTGYWHDGKSLSLGATFHICNMHFRYHELARSDRGDIIKPSFALLNTVPRADAIVRQTLRQQSSWRDSKGVLRKAAWNRAAYGYTENPDSGKSKCYMGSTWDAIYLLRLAGRHVQKPEVRNEIYIAIKDAFFYMLNHMILPDGNWRKEDISDNPDFSYVTMIFQDSHYLERRIFRNFPQCQATAQLNGERAVIHVKIPDQMDSARIYAVPISVPVEKVDERYLIGIIQKRGRVFSEMDPWVVYQICDRAAQKRFGRPIFKGGGSKDGYLSWKLNLVNLPIPFTCNEKPLISKMDLEGKKLYVSTCNWYGEESIPIEVHISGQ